MNAIELVAQPMTKTASRKSRRVASSESPTDMMAVDEQLTAVDSICPCCNQLVLDRKFATCDPLEDIEPISLSITIFFRYLIYLS